MIFENREIILYPSNRDVPLTYRCRCNSCKGKMLLYRRKRQAHLVLNGPMKAKSSLPDELDKIDQPSPPSENDTKMEMNTSEDVAIVTAAENEQHEMSDDIIAHRPPVTLSTARFDQNTPWLSPDSAWNELTSMLYGVQSRHRLSKKAMTDLLKFTERARMYTQERLNMDWRTVLAHKAKHELEVLRKLVGNHAAKSSFGEDVFTCSSCARTTFSLIEIEQAEPCMACEIPWVKCSFRDCQVMCVCTSRLGNRSLNSIVDCLQCSLNANSSYTARNYVFDLKKSIQSMFLMSKAVDNALAPWRSDGVVFFSGGRPGVPVTPCDNWLSLWRQHVASLPYRSEAWHGNRFLQHPIWEKHGIRSMLLVVFLDWFPPFEDNNPYSIGVMSIGILNYSCVERARIGAIWPIMILSGPSQLKHMYATMRDLFAVINDLFVNGVTVYDDLTKATIKVHLTVAQVVADRPAAAKIGEFKSYSAYFGCHKCHYKASLCCHVCASTDDDNQPVIYDNANFDDQTMSEDDRVLISGVPRPKRSGEHLVWPDEDLIARSRLSVHDNMVADQFDIHENIMDNPENWTRTHMNEWIGGQKYNGLSPLIHVDHFSLVDDIVIDGMHMFFKGINLQLAKLTFLRAKKEKVKPWNLHFEKSKAHVFDTRMARFTLPPDFPRHKDISTKLSKVKAEGMFKFLKVQALLALENLVPGEVWDVWRQMVQLTCGLLHTHVSKEWVTSPQGLALAVKNLISSFRRVYGICRLSPNWHLMLHLATDFEDWSVLRTHWTFASERVNHELLKENRAGSLARVDASIASLSTKFTSMKALSLSLERNDTHEHLRHRFDESYEHCPDMLAFIQKGYLTTKSGVIRALSGKVIECSIGDIIWVCDPSISIVPQSSEKNLFMVLVIACLPGKQEFVFTISRLVGLTKRIGYSNTFNWTQNNSEQLQQPPIVMRSDCDMLCEAVAVYNESGFKQVLIPACGNIPY